MSNAVSGVPLVARVFLMFGYICLPSAAEAISVVLTDIILDWRMYIVWYPVFSW